jgi:hypothetical protein
MIVTDELSQAAEKKLCTARNGRTISVAPKETGKARRLASTRPAMAAFRSPPIDIDRFSGSGSS